jgi:hypothetical protein
LVGLDIHYSVATEEFSGGDALIFHADAASMLHTYVDLVGGILLDYHCIFAWLRSMPYGIELGGRSQFGPSRQLGARARLVG